MTRTEADGVTVDYRLAELIVDSLVAHGVDRAFSVPGESFLPLLDALRDRTEIDVVTSRHEGAAALAAVGDAKLTGRPGVVMASRGPGAFNAALGLHVAEQEAIPLILLLGQVDLPNLGRNAVQEIDTATTFAGVIKWSTRLGDPALAREQIARAFVVATSGTPGPVVIELPEDALAFAASPARPTVHGTARPGTTTEDTGRASAAIAAAEKPILIVGGECRTPEFRADLIRMCDHLGLPVVLTNKNQDQFPNRHALYAGQMGFFPSAPLKGLIEGADLIVAIGTRLGDLSTMGFSFPRQLPAAQPLVHVYPDANLVGRRFETAVPVVSTAHDFVRAMIATDARRATPCRLAEIEATRRAVHEWRPERLPQADVFGHAVDAIAAAAEQEAVITTDSGNFAGWVHRAFAFTPAHRLLGSGCGAMGSGVPSGIAAALRYPGRRVIAFCGDGGFLMTGNELAVASARGLDLMVVVSNNGSYGTIRSHQERAFPGRVSGTDLANPDFAALGAAFGAKAFRIASAEEARPTVVMAMAERGPVLIEVVCDVRQTLEISTQAMAT
ncbi:thiamine pyrophosphate-binding protein [Boseaceae bacterium BT-24-1]|nr:thiamine pyrophosphate-binding protein [Boseaceae bacterium BT-24-1]